MKNMRKYTRPEVAKYQIECESSFATSRITSQGCYEIEDFKVYEDAYADFDNKEARPIGDNEFN